MIFVKHWYAVALILINSLCFNFIDLHQSKKPSFEVVSLVDQSFNKIGETEALNEGQQLLLAKVYGQVYHIPENKKVIDLLSQHNASIRFVINSNLKSPGAYYKDRKEIHFKDDKSINYHVLVEELFHAYQFQVKKIDLKYVNYSKANIEFEAKVYSDFIQMKYMTYLVGDHDIPLVILGNSSKSYLRWLNQITNNFSTYPKWSRMQKKYFYFMEKFTQEKDAYNFPINKQNLPISLFSVFHKKGAISPFSNQIND